MCVKIKSQYLQRNQRKYKLPVVTAIKNIQTVIKFCRVSLSVGQRTRIQNEIMIQETQANHAY